MLIGDHHERQDGKGYPKGIKGNLIYDLAKIVSIANFFDHKVGESKKELLYEQQLEAISILAKDNAMIFEPAKLQKAIKIFERTFSSLKYEP